MAFWKRSELLDGPAELADIEPALRAAADRFRRDLATHEWHQAGPVGGRRTRLPPIRVRRPVRMPSRLPRRPRVGRPRTILDRISVRSPFAAIVEANARRITGSIRQRLIELRRALARLGTRTGGIR